MTPVLAPLAGRVVALASVPDPVFAGEMVGPGVAIDPARDEPVITVTAPIAGSVAVLHPHAFVVSEGETSVLVHLGLDTVALGGAPFEVHTRVGERVRPGRRMITWNLAGIGALSPLVPVVALGAAGVEALAEVGATVAAGQRLFTLA